MTDATPIAPWTSKTLGEISHEDVLRMLNTPTVQVVGFIDGPVDRIAIRYVEPRNESTPEWIGQTHILANEARVSMGRWLDPTLTLVPIFQFEWTDDYSWMRTLTCINHWTAKYYTKNPFTRGIHFITTANGFRYGQECPCEFKDFAVVCNRDGIAVGKPADCEPKTAQAIPSLADIDDWKRY